LTTKLFLGAFSKGKISMKAPCLSLSGVSISKNLVVVSTTFAKWQQLQQKKLFWYAREELI
jgi:hypothetical protein